MKLGRKTGDREKHPVNKARSNQGSPKNIPVGGALALSLVAMLLSQSAAADDGCRDLLAGGVFNTENYSNSEDSAEIIAEFICSTSSSVKTESIALNGSAAVVMEGLPLKNTIGIDGTRSRQSRQEMCRDFSSYSALKKAIRSRRKTVSTELANAFLRCKGQTGLSVWLEPTQNPLRFLFVASYNPPSSSAMQEVTIKSFTADDGVECPGAEAPFNVGPQRKLIMCSREKIEIPVLIVVNANYYANGATQLTLPPGFVPPPPPPRPVRQEQLWLGKFNHPSAVFASRLGWSANWAGGRLIEDYGYTINCDHPFAGTALVRNGIESEDKWVTTSNMASQAYMPQKIGCLLKNDAEIIPAGAKPVYLCEGGGVDSRLSNYERYCSDPYGGNARQIGFTVPE